MPLTLADLPGAPRGTVRGTHLIAANSNQESWDQAPLSVVLLIEGEESVTEAKTVVVSRLSRQPQPCVHIGMRVSPAWGKPRGLLPLGCLMPPTRACVSEAHLEEEHSPGLAAPSWERANILCLRIATSKVSSAFAPGHLQFSGCWHHILLCLFGSIRGPGVALSPGLGYRFHSCLFSPGLVTL